MEKTPYIAAANDENDERQRKWSMGVPLTSEGRGGRQRPMDKLHETMKTLSRIRNHSAFKAGANLACFEASLKPELVNIDRTDKDMTSRANDIFGYDEKRVDNPAGSMANLKVCSEKFGMCCKHELREQAQVLTKNLYHVFRSAKQDFPI